GGELSRISLAIQVITAKTSDTPTLVFDEVDVGVGGATAEVVGSLLRKLGSNTQVICVTHLPQVAAQGHHHYVVSKETTDSSAATSVTKLTEEEKVDEIARMLGGVEQTEESLAHAQSMLSGNQGT
ncbi:MAG: DNA repair protein RecN, partial [Gammaproteobacteria bacterium]|nr:DNA repair protein RecN [Gammaproteobacteria bacterium]